MNINFVLSGRIYAETLDDVADIIGLILEHENISVNEINLSSGTEDMICRRRCKNE